MATVRYFVADLDQAVGFYTKQLDFAVQQQFGPNMAILRQGDLTLWLAGSDASAAADAGRAQAGAGRVEPLRAGGHGPRHHSRATEGRGRALSERDRFRTGWAADPGRGSVRQRGGTVPTGGLSHLAEVVPANCSVPLYEFESRAT
jgi:catechol 2,3-dioxygenase-like lactoylglutathione lyase family enzyme